MLERPVFKQPGTGLASRTMDGFIIDAAARRDGTLTVYLGEAVPAATTTAADTGSGDRRRGGR